MLYKLEIENFFSIRDLQVLDLSVDGKVPDPEGRFAPIFVGADVPMQDLPTMLAFFEADLLMLGATLGTQVPRVEQAIRSIRERCERPVRVIVGGAAFDEAPDLWERIGGDGYAPSIVQALEVGARLVGLTPPSPSP